jgi:hypothetical protein
MKSIVGTAKAVPYVRERERLPKPYGRAPL